MLKHALKVGEESKDLRIDVYLTKTLPEVPSRSFIQKLIESGKVFVNDRTVKPNYKVSVNDRIAVDFELLTTDDLAAEDIPLDIFYEDDDILIVYKPAGMIVHPAQGCYTGTLVNALLHHCKSLSSINTSSRPGIVHRLDRETSGLMVVAKTNLAHARLARQFEKHTVRKRYVALVNGVIEFDEGMIDASLGRHPVHREKKTVVSEEGGKEAKTFYQVLRRFKDKTLVALFPRTGRTHQLRVHMRHLGHSILGDDKYGKKDSFPRLALHAQSIGFLHPVSKKYIEFSSVMPAEFLPEK